MDPLRTVILGLQELGADLCAAAHREPALRIVAVADSDKALAERKARNIDVEAYDDYRLAIVEQSPQVLLMSLPLHQRAEYLKLAASREIAVLTTGPATSAFDSTLEFAKLFASKGVPLSVCRCWQTEPAYIRLADIESWAGKVFSAHVNVLAPAGDLEGWRGDSARAGGGVLLNDSYDQLDALVSIMGMPDEVYAVLARPFVGGEARPYDTEDAATVMMRFSSDRVATMCTRRAGNEDYWRYRLHGTEATVVITPGEMVVTDVNAKGNATDTYKVRTSNRLAPAVSTFATAIAAGLETVPLSIQQHLPTMAVMQTAYLSAKTGQPESPSKLYQAETGREMLLR